MRKIDKKAVFILSLLALALLAFSPAWAGYQEINQKLETDKYVQKANSFLVLFDNSGSMAGQKYDLERQLVVQLSNTLPTLRYTAGLRSFGENYCNFDLTKLRYGVGNYDRDEFNMAVTKIKYPLGKTPLDAALKAAIDDLKRAPGKLAVIVFSDGEDMDDAPVKAAAQLKAAYGDKLCIYTVQLGNDAMGAKLLDRIAQAGQCGSSVRWDAVVHDTGMTAFVEKIFLEPKAAEAAKEAKPAAAAPAAAPAPKKVSITLDVKFDTGKSVVRPIFWWDVQKFAEFMKQYPDTQATIEGYTDSVGKEAMNMKLSEARAKAVAKILTDKYGIDKSRLKTVGFGPKKPIADNKTAEGKQQNRRVESRLEAMAK